MSEKQTPEFQAVMDTLHCMMQQINENSRATQNQIDEFKTGLYAPEERVTQLEQKQKKRITYPPKAVDKNEIVQIVREVMRECGGVFERKEVGTVLNKEKVYARCEKCGYTRHQVLTGLRDAEILVTGNDGHSLRVVWDCENRKAYRAIVVSL